MPVVTGKSLVDRGIGDRREVVDLERCRLISGWREIKAARSGLLERWCGVVGCIDRATKHRRRRHHLEFIVRWNVEQIQLAAVGDRTLAGIAVPFEKLVVVLWRI